MSQEIEIEFKNMLTEEEFYRLRDHFKSLPKQQIRQTNHYFETEDFLLKQRGAALRIREKSKQYVVTLKQPNPNGAGLLETHNSLTEAEANCWMEGTIIPKPPIEEALSQLDIDIYSLKYGGMLQTDRTQYPLELATVVLDKSYYNDHLDYELELEVSEEKEGLRLFRNLLSKHHIPERETKNKIERFYRTLKWQEKGRL